MTTEDYLARARGLAPLLERAAPVFESRSLRSCVSSVLTSVPSDNCTRSP